LTLRGLRELSLRDFDPALRRSEEIYCGELLKTADVGEGVAAFLEKRPPNWCHR
jgi:enoyl-CoA hydratase/carnithine racemase